MQRPHTSYGRRKLGGAAHAAQQAKKKATTQSGIVYGPRKIAGAAAVAPSSFLALIEGLHGNPISWAKARVAELDLPGEIQALHELEHTNPKGPRKGILDLLEERLGELGVLRPSLEVVAGAAPEDAPDAPPASAETDPFEGDGVLAVSELERILEDNPALLDRAIDAEFKAGAPRPEAVKLFRGVEAARGDGARPEVVKLLALF